MARIIALGQVVLDPLLTLIWNLETLTRVARELNVSFSRSFRMIFWHQKTRSNNLLALQHDPLHALQKHIHVSLFMEHHIVPSSKTHLSLPGIQGHPKRVR